MQGGTSPRRERCIDTGKTSILPFEVIRCVRFTHFIEGSPLKTRLASAFRRLAVAVPFFVLAVLVLAFLADPVQRGGKERDARTQVQPETGGGAAGAAAER